MESCCARRLGWPGIIAVAVVVGWYVHGWARPSQAQTPETRAGDSSGAAGVRDVRSAHFLIHTDLWTEEANQLAERLEVLLRLVSSYWGRPMRGVIECYVISDLDTFPTAAMAPEGVSGIRTFGGVTLMRTVTDGRRYLAKSVVYANARPEVVQHEVVHAYCHHTFGRIGPVWYSEGMAEMGHYWTERDSAVRVESREIEFLHEDPPKELTETLSPSHASGDSWQNYALHWALCHFLKYNPNYSPQFWTLGRALLTGREVRFEQAFGRMEREMSFEYRFFLEHLGPGYRVDLCAWDWNKRAVCLQSGRRLTTTIAAGRGWQPSGLAVRSGVSYQYVATGKWQIAGVPEAVDANGDGDGRGRLVGVLMKDYQLGPEFELQDKGSLQREADGDLYLRCRNAWNELSDDSGRLTVKFEIQGRGPSPGRTESGRQP